MSSSSTHDGVVLRVAGCIGLAVQQPAHERVEGKVNRVHRFEHEERVTSDRRQGVMGIQPLHRFRWPDDRGRCLAEFDRERFNDLDLALGDAVEHGW